MGKKKKKEVKVPKATLYILYVFGFNISETSILSYIVRKYRQM